MRGLRQLIQFAYVPFMLFGLNGAAYFVVTQEHSPLWLAPLLVAAFALAHAAERILPWYQEWNDSHDDDKTNLLHTLVYEGSNINGLLMIPLIVWLFPADGIWPKEWPVWAQLLLAIGIADFVFMLVHFFSHRWPVLWRLHAVHHGVGRLYSFNGLVRHPLHQSLDMILGTAPLVILGMPVSVALLLGFAISVQLIVQHSNVAYALGPLRNHLSIGQIHHLHHVNWGKEGDCNFGLFFTLWDRLLGTFKAQPTRPIKAADMGIDEVPDFPKGYIAQIVFPFVYTPGRGAPKTRERHNDASDGQRLHPAE